MDWKQNWPVRLFEIVSLFAAGSLTAAYLLHLGEPNPLETLTNLLTSFYALLATWMAIAGWTLLAPNEPGRREWTLLSIGIGLWTMAELLWAFLSYMLEETPYPSAADAFWVPGYVIILIAAYLRYRAIRIEWNPRIGWPLAAGFVLLFVVVFVLLILPVLLVQAESLLALLLNLFYPIADLLLLYAALLLTVSFAGGWFSTPWRALSAGLAMLSLSDILFTYADAGGLYTPDGKLTVLTTVVDVGNLAAYILLAYGMLLNQRLLSDRASAEPTLTQPSTTPAANQDVMIFLDNTDRVVFASYNILELLPEGKNSAAGLPLVDVLRLSQADGQAITNELHAPRRGRIEKYIVQYREDGTEVHGWLRGQANFNDLREYTGADLTCAVQTRKASGWVSAARTLVFASQEEKLALEYFSRRVHCLYEGISRMGGAAVSHAFETVFQEAAGREKNGVFVKQGRVIVEGVPPRPEVCARILDALSEYARNTLSREMAAGIEQRVNAAVSDEMRAAARKFGLMR